MKPTQDRDYGCSIHARLQVCVTASVLSPQYTPAFTQGALCYWAHFVVRRPFSYCGDIGAYA